MKVHMPPKSRHVAKADRRDRCRLRDRGEASSHHAQVVKTKGQKNMRFDHSAILKVGEGRGFVIGAGNARYIITAGHCLPKLPPCASTSYPKERKYDALLGRLHKEASAGAECRFVDPIMDIAVLGPPEQAYDYDKLINDVPPLRVGRFQSAKDLPARLLTLDNRWTPSAVTATENGTIWIRGEAKIKGGMSGSPIVIGDDIVVGVVTTSAEAGTIQTLHGPQARLTHHLPGWLLCALDITTV